MAKPAKNDALTILQALQAELTMFVRTGMRAQPGMVALWLSDVDKAISKVEG